MKSPGLFLISFALASVSAFSQNSSSTKIYFYSIPSSSLITTLNPDMPIRIGKCTLLETDEDSLGINILKDKIIYIHFERGHTYYYRNVGGGRYAFSTLSACSESEFWLNTYFAGVGTYRHYFLDKKSGLKLIEGK